MTFSYRSIALALMLTAVVVTPGQAAEAADIPPLLTKTEVCLDDIAGLYHQAIIDGTPPTTLYQQLDRHAIEQPALRPRVLVSKGYLAWQQGDIAQATIFANQALAAGNTVEAKRLKARLQDASGDTLNAVKTYKQVLEQTTDPAQRMLLQRTLVLLQRHEQLDTLRPLTQQQRDPGNAALLALLGYPAEAEHTYPHSAKDTSYQQWLRTADWAISAKDYRNAEQLAWHAFTATDNIAEQRYALALLVEAFRQSGELDEAIRFLAKQPRRLVTEQVKVDIMLETGHFNDAVELVRQAPETELRQRLVTILEMAGDKQQLEQEYQRLIAENPEQLQWYKGLATLYLTQGKNSAAEALYDRLLQTHRGDNQTLLPLTEQMIAIGMYDKAIAVISQQMHNRASATLVRLFLIDTYIDHGKDEAALAQLAILQQQLPATDRQRLRLADDYERLHQLNQAFSLFQGLQQAGVTLNYDQQVHMATLAYESDQLALALAQWQQLWQQSTLPARKHYLEKQVIKVAGQMGQLPALIQSLQQKIKDKNGNQRALDLLVSINLQQKKYQQAIATVRRYAQQHGVNQLEQLKQISALYLRVKDFAAFNDSMERLATLDPENADLYLRQQILNTLKNTLDSIPVEQQQNKLDTLLHQLQQVSGANLQTDKFAAGIYAMAHLNEEAIKRYRQAWARDPQQSDNLLQMAELMKKQQQQQQAVQLLQYAVLQAKETNTFAAAVDGLLNTLTGVENSQGQRADSLSSRSTVLQWIQRQILLRIATAPDSFYLYSLLADIAQENADFELVARAYQNALALSDIQRPELLRQLINLFSGNTENSSTGGPLLGDKTRKIIFGRRLLALKREYPPELYSDLANTLLDSGDILGAEQAFTMMPNIHGLVNVDEIKGDSYVRAGYTDKALTDYGRALLNDQDNITLTIKTSILREQKGQDALAHRWYWHALTHLLMQQPLLDEQGQVSLDFKRYYQTLAEGWLLTGAYLPAETHDISGFMARIDDTLHEIKRSAPDQPFNHYLRLNLLLRLGLRLAEHQAPSLASAMDTQLAPYFADDPDYQAAMQRFARLTGSSSQTTENPAQGYQALVALAEQAEEENNFSLRLALAIDQQDGQTLQRLTQEALNIEQQRQQPAEPGQKSVFLPNYLYSVIVETLDRLPAKQFKQWVYQPLKQSPFYVRQILDLFRSLPDRYRKLEQQLGQPLLSHQQLIQLLVEHGNDPLTFTRHYRPKENMEDYILQNFSTRELLELYTKLVKRLAFFGGHSSLQDGLLNHLLRTPLTQEQQQSLLSSLHQDIARKQENISTSAFLIPRLLVLDVPEQNQALLRQAAKWVAEQYQDAEHLPSLFDAWFSGQRPHAFSELLALYDQTQSSYVATNYAAPLIKQYFTEERQQYIDAFLNNEHPSAAAIQLFYRQFVQNNIAEDKEHRQQDVIRYYQKLLQLAPDNLRYRVELLTQYWQVGDAQAFTSLLTRYVTAHPDSREAATVLYYALQSSGKQQEAVHLAQDASSFTDPDWLRQMVNKANASRQNNSADISKLFNKVYQRYQAQQPHEEQQQATTVLVPPQKQDEALSQLATAYARSPAQAAAMLRAIWRNSLISPGQEQSSAISRSRLLTTQFDLNGKTSSGTHPTAQSLSQLLTPAPSEDIVTDLLMKMAASPAITDEIDAYILAVPPASRQWLQRLYDLLAEGLIQQDKAQTTLQDLLAQLGQSDIDGHHLQLLVTLANATQQSLTASQVQILLNTLAQRPELSPRQRVMYAALLARSEHYQQAGQLLTAAVLQQLYPSQQLSQAALYDRGQTQVALNAIISQLTQWQDRQQAQQTYTRLMQILATNITELGSQGPAQLRDMLALLTVPQVADGQEAIALLARVAPQALTLKAKGAYSAEKALALTHFHVKQQQYQQAFAALSRVLSPTKQANSYINDRDTDVVNGLLFGSRHQPRQGLAALFAAIPQVFPATPGIAAPWMDYVTKQLAIQQHQGQLTHACYGDLSLLLIHRYQTLGMSEQANQSRNDFKRWLATSNTLTPREKGHYEALLRRIPDSVVQED